MKLRYVFIVQIVFILALSWVINVEAIDLPEPPTREYRPEPEPDSKRKDITYIKAGENATIWAGIKEKGNFHIKIVAKDENNCVKLWWITGESIRTLGKYCNEFTVQYDAVASQLRVGNCNTDTIVFLKVDGEGFAIDPVYNSRWPEQWDAIKEVWNDCGTNFSCWQERYQ